jgi:VWFA-related protein
MVVRFTARFALLACLLVLAPPHPARAQQQEREQQPTTTTKAAEDDEVERVSVHLVSVPVSVTDRDGRFVADLTERDFRVAENGVAQAITNFASVEQPFSVLLLIDTSGSTQLRLRDIQDSAVAFVRQLRPQDRVLPVAFDNDAVALLPRWSSDPAALASAIRATRTGMVPASDGAKVIRGRDGKPVALRQVNTRLYDAIHNAALALREVRGRKAMIVFTDGFDNASAVATRKSTLAEAEELDALIYVVRYARYPDKSNDEARADAVDTRPPVVGPPTAAGKGNVEVGTTSGGQRVVMAPAPAPSQMPGRVVVPQYGRPLRPFGARHPYELAAENYLEDLAGRTGGRYYYADNLERIAQAFAAVADELRRMYSIGYHPTPLARPGERREVKIKVARERVSVRARKAYVFKPR